MGWMTISTREGTPDERTRPPLQVKDVPPYVEIQQVDLAPKVFLTEMHKKNRERNNETDYKRSEEWLENLPSIIDQQ